jgi:DUF4097 and DUF4098 domain-containing protein YvlB
MRLRTFATLAAAAVAGGCSFNFRGDGRHLFDDLERATRTESRALDLASGETLLIDGLQGDVRVRVDAAAAPRVDSTWTAYGRTRDDAQAILDGSTLTVEKSGDAGAATLHLSVKTVEPPPVFGVASFVATPDVDLALSIPKGVSLIVKTRYGDVAVDGPVRDVDVEAPQGDVRVVDAQSATVASHSGKLTLEKIRGPVTATTDFDSIEIDDVDGPAIDARSNSGAIRVSNARAPRIELTTAYDDIVVRDVAGRLDAGTRSGAIRVDGFRGAVRAETEYDDVLIDGELEGVDAQSKSGKIRIVARPGSRVTTPWRIETSWDDVLLDLPADFDADLDATTTNGVLTGDFEVKSSRNDDPARARVKFGSGGAPIRVLTSSGDVKVVRR